MDHFSLLTDIRIAQFSPRNPNVQNGSHNIRVQVILHSLHGHRRPLFCLDDGASLQVDKRQPHPAHRKDFVGHLARSLLQDSLRLWRIRFTYLSSDLCFHGTRRLKGHIIICIHKYKNTYL